MALSIVFIANNTLAQNPTARLAQDKQPYTIAVTASVSAADSIRVTAPGQNLSIRLEIYAASGNWFLIQACGRAACLIGRLLMLLLQ